MDSTEIGKRSQGDDYRQVCANRMENLEERDNLLESTIFQDWTEEVENMYRPGTGTKPKLIKQLWTHKSAGPDGATGILSNI